VPYAAPDVTVHADARALEWVGSEYMIRWLRRLPETAMAAFGAAVAFCTPDRPEVDFLNTVHRLLPDEVTQVPAITAHYARSGVRPWLELMPAPGFERLAETLRAAGAGQIGFLAMLERELPVAPPDPPPHGVVVEQVTADVEDFVRVLPTGHEVEAASVERAIASTRHQARVEDARFYVARVDGTPAAAGVLFLHEGIAYLANASTLPAFRRRGCQSALIERRLADATAAGYRRAAVIVEWASQSHTNLARAGFRTAYTKAIWRLGAVI
jgi:GNAT superfamily N-acetyltransferase